MDKKKYRAYICCGPNCGPKGSPALLDELQGLVAANGLEGQVGVLPTGCQSHCESGPTMVVYPGPVYYQGIDAGRLKRILREHFQGDRPVGEYFWTGTRRKILPSDKMSRQPQRNTPPSPERVRGLAPGKPVPKARVVEDVDDFKW